MVAKKIFHVLVGFWFTCYAFLFLYFAVATLYAWLTDMSDDVDGPLFALPRLAMILSAPLPLAGGFVIWRTRRCIAMGIMAFGITAFAFWLAVGRMASL
jgi:hypothetical protein